MTQRSAKSPTEALGHRSRSTQRTPATLARLMIWLSPAYPVGGYSYSHGLEWIIEAGQVRDVETLVGWIEDLLTHRPSQPTSCRLLCASSHSDRAMACGCWRGSSR